MRGGVCRQLPARTDAHSSLSNTAGTHAADADAAGTHSSYADTADTDAADTDASWAMLRCV